MPNDPNISVPVGSSTSIRTVTEHKDVGVSFGSGFPGTTQHIQVVTVGFHDGTSVTHDIVSSARPRANSREGFFENNKTRFKTDGARSGWWEALKRRFYRDMG